MGAFPHAKRVGNLLFLSGIGPRTRGSKQIPGVTLTTDGKIDNYQLVVPTTWNGSPRDARQQHSSFEASLIGTPVANLEQPVEIIRTIHSFDPCLACAVHLYDPQGRHLHQVSFE